jgi:peptidyl-prolyl cis-trans isomerase D
MFDYVRKHTKIMMGLMFLLIIPSFVLFGIDGYNRFREKGQTVARVGGHDISQGDWDAAHKVEVDRLRAAMPNLDPKLLDSQIGRASCRERV